MNLFLFLLAITVAFVIVRIGAVAFELTGLEWSLAKFQALSCFTGTGFTTKEAELITGNPQRRRIASVLIVLGHAGLVTLVATFANSLRPVSLAEKIQIPFLHLVFPAWLLPVMNLVVIICAGLLFYRLFTHAKFTSRVTEYLRTKIVKKKIISPVTFEELLVATGGYGVSQIEVCAESGIAGKSLAEADLRRDGINVLAIERGGRTMTDLSALTLLREQDKVICFGRLESIRRRFGCEGVA
ncbi:MAG: hypothetical protein GF333_01235 [Candidatus Omnitrophica bacterium]|nr:hypothetical protein [Candidatus Omnitrophota bacterium]